MKPDDTSKMCAGCGRPRRVFVVFADRDGKHGDFEACTDCVGHDLERKPAPSFTEPAK